MIFVVFVVLVALQEMLTIKSDDVVVLVVLVVSGVQHLDCVTFAP